MKKLISLALVLAMALSILAGCGATADNGGNNETAAPASALEVLENIWALFGDDEKFPVMGGDFETGAMDAPAVWKSELLVDLSYSLQLPEAEMAKVADAATMIHMMNANTFTGAAYHLTGDVSADEFADALKEGILAKQWICGMPDTLVVINVDGQYVIAAYGADDLVETFKDNALSALDGAEAIIDTPVVEG